MIFLRTVETSGDMKMIIESESGIAGTCLLGIGNSESEAWEDAFGPKPWTPSTKRAACKAWVREVNDDEAEELQFG